MIEFSATVEIIGINPFVEPPDAILRAIFKQADRSKGPIPVRGRICGAEFIQTLVKYRGLWRLYINGPMMKDSGLKVGDRAVVEIAFDPRSREAPVPPAFAKALKLDRLAKAGFDRLTASRKKEILRYLGSLKTEVSLDRNIERTVKHLRGEKTDALHALMRKPKSDK